MLDLCLFIGRVGDGGGGGGGGGGGVQTIYVEAVLLWK